jgi:eukaryotic-like serine/threonine-protein kinase
VHLSLTPMVSWSDVAPNRPILLCAREEGTHVHPRGILMNRIPGDAWSDPELDRKYQYERHLASSAMAVVVVARHLQLDDLVAIKFLSPEALRSSAAVNRFRREAKAAARIKNQHVVRIIDVAETVTGIPYIVMEYLDGKDLECLLAQCPMRQAAIPDAIDYVLQASEAVIEGHRLGIVHRDLKPANLLCVDRGDGYPLVKVLDFGISKFIATQGEVEGTDRYEILGSPSYMSPEQIDSTCSVDHRTDIWSLGVILYQAISGQLPFTGDLVPDLWRKIRHDSPTPLFALRPDCSTELWKIVARCLEKEPERRFAHLAELALALAPMAPNRSSGSIDRIRWTADSAHQPASRPSCFSTCHDRTVTNSTRGSHRWLLAGGLASTLGVGLTLTANYRDSELHYAPPQPLPLGSAWIADDVTAVAKPTAFPAAMSSAPLAVVVTSTTTSESDLATSSSRARPNGAGRLSTSKPALAPRESAVTSAGLFAAPAVGVDEGAPSPSPSTWLVEPITRRK